MAWTQKNSGARVEFRFCLLCYHYTALCTDGGAGGSFVLLLFKRRLSFFSGGSDGLSNGVGVGS